eukprot:6916147-Prymnesium_polylepis.2
MQLVLVVAILRRENLLRPSMLPHGQGKALTLGFAMLVSCAKGGTRRQIEGDGGRRTVSSIRFVALSSSACSLDSRFASICRSPSTRIRARFASIMAADMRACALSRTRS